MNLICSQVNNQKLKKVHYADKIRSDGAVKALCYKINVPINLKTASWTNRKEAVTCKKCIAKMIKFGL